MAAMDDTPDSTVEGRVQNAITGDYLQNARISIRGSDRVVLTDLGSSNGTFVRLLEERELHDQDVLLMGQQVFRVTF